MSRFVVAAASESLAERMQQVVDGLDGALEVVLSSEPLPEQPRGLFAHVTDADPADVVVLGPESLLTSSLELTARLNEQYPWISVVLVADAGPDLWADAMRAGVREILAPNASAREISQVITRAAQSAAARRQVLAPAADTDTAGGREGRVIAVISPKGGSGKTTVATNLALGLGARFPLDTVLVDLDVQFGDVATALQMKPQYTLAEAVHGPAASDAMVLKSYLTAHANDFYAVCAPDSPAVGDAIRGEQVSNLLQQLASEFRYVIVDTAPGLGEHTLAAIEQATDAVMVCGMDVPSVLGLRKEIAVLGELGMIPGARHVVLNFASKSSGMSVRDVEASTGVPVDFVLPHSRAVPLSTNRGVPLLQEPTRDPVAKGLRALVQRFEPTAKGARKATRLSRKAVAR